MDSQQIYAAIKANDVIYLSQSSMSEYDNIQHIQGSGLKETTQAPEMWL